MKTWHLAVILGLALGLPAPAIELYVASGGNDAWSGLLPEPDGAGTNGPLATLQKARDLLRERRRQGGKPEAVTVTVRGGTHVLAETFELTAEDSGTEACPVVYRAFPGETVVLSGARVVEGWKPAGDGLFVASLAGKGFLRSHQLFFRGERQTLARYPNLDPEHPHTGGFLHVDGPSYEDNRTGFRYGPGEIPFEQWGDLSQAEVNIFPYNCWDHNIVPIRRAIPAIRQVRLRYPVAGRINEGNRYFLQGVREALDVSGEWHANWQTGELAFRPPGGRVGNGDVTIPVVENLVLLRGTAAARIHHVTITGFRFAYAEQDGIILDGADQCAVTACTFRHFGGVGVNAGFVRNARKGIGNAWRRGARPRIRIHSGDRSLCRGTPSTNCRIAGNDIDSVGSDGIILVGNANTADNNHILRVGQYDMVCAGVTVYGDENRVSHNEIHDVPRDGVFVNGARNIVEYNTIRNSMLYTADNSAIALRQHNVAQAVKDVGNVIRFNRILDTIGYGSYPHCGHPPKGFGSPFASWGIYLDGSICGVTVYGNVIARSGSNSMFIQFGGGNVVENNICVEPAEDVIQYNSVLFFGWFMHPDREGRFPQLPNQIRHNIFWYRGKERKLYSSGLWGHPEAHPDQAVFDRNLIWNGGTPVVVEMDPKHRYESLTAWQAGSGHDRNSVVADPLFVDLAGDDYRLRPDSPAFGVGFKDINAELGKIGPYASPERANWPLVDRIVPREIPLVFEYSKPPKPLVDGFELVRAGGVPMRAKVNDEGKALVTITAEEHTSGRQCLRFVDAPDLQHQYNPHIEYRIPFPAGKLHFSIDVMNSANAPADWYMEFRDWRGKPLVGPTFRGGPDGSLAVGGRFGSGGTTVASIPPGTWFTVGIDFAAGEGAAKTYSLTLDVPGRARQVLRDLPFADPEFRDLTWFGISSMSTAATVFMVDNLVLGAADSPDVLAPANSPAFRGLGKTDGGEASAPVGNAEQLVLSWDFDENDGDTVRDGSGNALHGDRNGGAWARGEFGWALLCDGNEAEVELSDEAVLELGASDFTIECWLYPSRLAIDSPHQRRRLLDKGLCPTVWWNVDLLVTGQVRMEMGGLEKQNATTDSHGRLPEHRWTHLAIVVDRRNFTTSYYFNGKRDSVRPFPRTFTTGLSTSGKSFTIGAWQPYIGLVDDLRIYKRALSGTEAAAHAAKRREKYASPKFTVVEE